MRKFFVFALGMAIAIAMSSQTLPPWTEDFDGSVSFTAKPSNSWISETVYYAPNSLGANPKSYLGLVPNNTGDTSILETVPYDCSHYSNVILRFSHICKVSPLDIVRLEYRTGAGGGMGRWDSIPVDTYLGSAKNFHKGFSAASYPQWMADDSTVFPSQSWWKEEAFDLWFQASGTHIQFRFMIIHGKQQGTQLSYGWLIDNFQLSAATYQLYPPTVEFLPPFVKDTVYHTGPFEINAKVKTRTNVAIVRPYLKYTTTYNGVSLTDSVEMTSIEGDSLWRATIPKHLLGTKLSYSITGVDLNGNRTMAASDFVIEMGNEKAIILQDGGLTTDSYPFKHIYGYSQSMSLYLASEIKPRIPGLINVVSLRVATAAGGAFPMKVWLKTLPVSKTAWDGSDDLSWSTLTRDATLVYDGQFHFSTTGWVDIPLENTFYYNGSDNLVVMFEQNCGGTSCSGYMNIPYPTYYSAASTNRFWRRFKDNTPPGAGENFSLTDPRPDLQIKITSLSSGDNAVSVISIDMNDTITVSPGVTIPVVATIKNNGAHDLDSVKVSYAVNGSAPTDTSIILNPSLPWDHHVQHVFGNYTPRVNKNDTLTVWVSMPNGQNDTENYDDTLTKIIYGASDMVMLFVTQPTDTVNHTGPFEITARIYSLSGDTVGPIFLYLKSVFNGVSTYDTLQMLQRGTNLWSAFMPQKVFGTEVTYSIAQDDKRGNAVKIEGSYFIRKIDCASQSSNNNYFILQEGKNSSEFYYPFMHNWGYSQAMALYRADEIDAAAAGKIDKISLRVAAVASAAFPVKIWLKTLPASKKTWNTSVDEVEWSVLTQNATPVYDGFFHFNKTGWVDIPLNAVFNYNGKDNLVVMFEQNCGGSSCSVHMSSYPTYYSSDATATMWHKWRDGDPPTVANAVTIRNVRPDLRIGVIPACFDSNSVSLVSINYPESGVGVFADGSSVPVQVTVKNKGTKVLDSCLINWSLNGLLQTVAIYRGTLQEDFTDTITIGSYIPQPGKHDTIVVWVSMPNGKIDTLMSDDTLKTVSLGCAFIASGTIRVGVGETFTRPNDVLNVIRNCGVSGDITLALKGTFAESIDLTDFSKYMRGYSLCITSLDHNADDAVIQPSAGAGIILSDMRNLILKDITVNVASASGTYAILFTGACSNIVIRDCKLLANPTGSLSTTAAVYKTSGTGIVDSIFFINNLLDGGYYGFHFYGSTGVSNFGKNVVFDNNTVQNYYYHGIFSYYVDFISCSYNTLLDRVSGGSSTWYGIYIYGSNGPFIGNRIIQRSSGTSYPTGIYSSYHNYYLATPGQGRALIANNEIILNTTSSYYGIYAYYSKSEIINNSIYISGSGGARGIYISTSTGDNMVIKNNNIVLTNASAYPIYFSSTGNLNMYDIDCNNLYAPNNVGYYNTIITSIQAWQQIITTDRNSVRVFPDFVDLSTNLKFADNVNLWCKSISPVNDDIEKTSRTTPSVMGCYEISPPNANVMLTEITGLNGGALLAQTDTLKVVVYNTGTTPLTSINLEWSVNGTLQNAGGTDYQVNINGRGQSDTITLGYISHVAGLLNVKVWLNNLNNGNVSDEKSNDDTISKSVYICSGMLSGLLRVGTSVNSDFNTVQQAYDALNVCGVNGDITFAFEPGVYTENLNLSNNTSLLSNYTLTITSVNNNATEVIIRPSSEAGVLLSNSKNIVLRAITIDATVSKKNAIEFTGACSNIVVRDCRLLASTTTSSSSNNPVYKASGTGIVDSIFFIGNLLDGGYYGFYFYGGTGTTANGYGNHVLFDSNTLSNQYYHGTYPVYVDFISCSYNKILSRTSENMSSTWYALRMYYANGPVIGNRIIQRSKTITQPYGIYSYYHNYHPVAPVQGKGLIANNEIILNTTGSYYGIYAEGAKLEVLHNSIFISGSGSARGIYISPTYSSMVIKNNNIVLTSPSSSAYPVYFGNTANLNLYDIDYNNYCAPTNIGYYNGAKTTMTAWQQEISTDIHSVKVSPVFVDTTANLKLSSFNDSLLCPVTAKVVSDIDGDVRAGVTMMGSYTQPPSGLDLMLMQVSPWNEEVINNQTVQVNVDIINMGAVPITDASFGWSVNGNVQQSALPWQTNLQLASLEQANITIGTFQAINADTFNILVWLETVNGKPDSVTRNDSVSAVSVKMPLAEFTAFMPDTVYTLDFDVKAKIRTFTGAPLSTPPVLHIETWVKETYFLQDSIPMTLQNNIWEVTIPQQYYNSKVVYSLTVSDTVNNTLTIKDSTCIKFRESGAVDDYIYFGAYDTLAGISNAAIVFYTAYTNSWSRHLYLNSELENIDSLRPVSLSSIAFKLTGISSSHRSLVRIYMKATTQTAQAQNYINPVTDGATLVYQGPVNMLYPNWIEIPFSQAFLLPQGSNLMVYIEDDSPSSGSYTWRGEDSRFGTRNMTVYGTSYLSGGSGIGARKPVTRFGVGGFDVYKGDNLALSAFLSPVNNMSNLCMPDSVPVIVTLMNLGENDYDFSKNPLTLKLATVDPNQTGSLECITIDTGILAVRKTDTIVLTSALSVMYSGEYNMKAWLESSVDNIHYDDTISYLYTSGRIGLPIDVDFSDSVILSTFIPDVVLGSEAWTLYSDSNSPVKPNFGNGMLRYVGNQGTMTRLLTRHLDLKGAVNPVMEFWYYHDSTASNMDKSYTDVNITVNNNPVKVLTLFRKGTPHGWKKYSVLLDKYTNAQCVLVEFMSMNKFGPQSAQYIDRILISSDLDVAVSEIFISSEVNICDLTNKTLNVVLSTVVNQAVDFSAFTDSLLVEVPGYSVFKIPLCQVIAGKSSDTVRIPNINIAAGISNVKAYLQSPVDANHANDTAKLKIDISPQLAVTVISSTGGVNCFKIGDPVYQEVNLKNIGNVDLPSVKLEVIIIAGNNNLDTIREISAIDLPTGADTSYTFKNTYSVPASEEEIYQVQVRAYLACNPTLINVSDAKIECVDMHDLAIISIDNPPKNQIDKVGYLDSVTISVKNTDTYRSFEKISVTAVIEDGDGVISNTLSGSIPKVDPVSSLSFTFTEKYTVPDDSVYFIRVYLNSNDLYPENDTLSVTRRTNYGESDIKSTGRISAFTLAQNIPNPAANSTRIDYTVPEAGEVFFYVHSISGQLLYSTAMEVPHGTHSLELNTTTFAAGVYFYSMEYKGQRQVKQLIISN
jgi:hypothetical protein